MAVIRKYKHLLKCEVGGIEGMSHISLNRVKDVNCYAIVQGAMASLSEGGYAGNILSEATTVFFIPIQAGSNADRIAVLTIRNDLTGGISRISYPSPVPGSTVVTPSGERLTSASMAVVQTMLDNALIAPSTLLKGVVIQKQ